jgi:hypothetical protein
MSMSVPWAIMRTHLTPPVGTYSALREPSIFYPATGNRHLRWLLKGSCFRLSVGHLRTCSLAKLTGTLHFYGLFHGYGYRKANRTLRQVDIHIL